MIHDLPALLLLQAFLLLLTFFPTVADISAVVDFQFLPGLTIPLVSAVAGLPVSADVSAFADVPKVAGVSVLVDIQSVSAVSTVSCVPL
jgi:hypothetical protein